MQFEKILIPVDFSDFSQTAVDYGLFLAEKYCSQVTLFHAMVLFREDVNEEAHFHTLEKVAVIKEQERTELLESHKKKGEVCGVRIQSKMVRAFSAADDGNPRKHRIEKMDVRKCYRKSAASFAHSGSHRSYGLSKDGY